MKFKNSIKRLSVVLLSIGGLAQVGASLENQEEESRVYYAGFTPKLDVKESYLDLLTQSAKDLLKTLTIPCEVEHLVRTRTILTKLFEGINSYEDAARINPEDYIFQGNAKAVAGIFKNLFSKIQAPRKDLRHIDMIFIEAETDYFLEGLVHILHLITSEQLQKNVKLNVIGGAERPRNEFKTAEYFNQILPIFFAPMKLDERLGNNFFGLNVDLMNKSGFTYHVNELIVSKYFRDINQAYFGRWHEIADIKVNLLGALEFSKRQFHSGDFKVAIMRHACHLNPLKIACQELNLPITEIMTPVKSPLEECSIHADFKPNHDTSFDYNRRNMPALYHFYQLLKYLGTGSRVE